MAIEVLPAGVAPGDWVSADRTSGDRTPGDRSPGHGGLVARPAREVLAWSRETVEPAMRAALDSLPGSMRLVAGYHLGWLDEDGDPVAASAGKALRPALVLLAAEAGGGEPADAVAAAVAVELVHNFSLLHDDVMDGDLTRRHRPTAWSVFGCNAAILAGDALLTLAFDVLAAAARPATSAVLQMVSAAVQDLVGGQSTDMAFEKRTDVDLPECLEMARLKTGALLACGCAVGAVSGGGGAEQVLRLHAFGERLGLAFQLVDDLLGIWGDPAVTGKPAYSDLRNRKKSLPVVAALTSGTPQARELAALYHRREPLSDSDLRLAATLIDAAGGRSWSQATADQLLEQALHNLRSATRQERVAAELTELANLITCRRS